VDDAGLPLDRQMVREEVGEIDLGRDRVGTIEIAADRLDRGAPMLGKDPDDAPPQKEAASREPVRRIGRLREALTWRKKSRKGEREKDCPEEWFAHKALSCAGTGSGGAKLGGSDSGA
jgi:hypothetical protein